MHSIPNVKTNQVVSLLSKTSLILKHQKEMETLRGDKFNIFTIIGRENDETNTHSAFIGELLNPKGSHLKGNIFLELFLKTIGVDTIDTTTAYVVLENHIGFTDLKNKTGGRIDIIISDHNQNSLSIENKIFAGDQEAQVERYFNHNKGRNTVFYLTLDGTHPSEKSSGKLMAEKDYFLISYKKTILDWLQTCLKESAETPILRETIRQYIKLIQILTKTMDLQETTEIDELLINHLEESSYIADNVQRLKFNIAETFRQEVLIALKSHIDNKDLVVLPGLDASNKYSHIWIKIKGFENSHLYFSLESFNFSGKANFNGRFFIGILNSSGKDSDYANEKNRRPIGTWILDHQLISHYSGFSSQLSDLSTLKEIHLNSEFKKGFINHILKETKEFIDKRYQPLLKFLKKGGS